MGCKTLVKHLGLLNLLPFNENECGRWLSGEQQAGKQAKQAGKLHRHARQVDICWKSKEEKAITYNLFVSLSRAIKISGVDILSNMLTNGIKRE